MQGSKRDTDVKNRLLDAGEGKGGMIGDSSIETWYICRPWYICKHGIYVNR